MGLIVFMKVIPGVHPLPYGWSRNNAFITIASARLSFPGIKASCLKYIYINNSKLRREMKVRDVIWVINDRVSLKC